MRRSKPHAARPLPFPRRFLPIPPDLVVENPPPVLSFPNSWNCVTALRSYTRRPPLSTTPKETSALLGLGEGLADGLEEQIRVQVARGRAVHQGLCGNQDVELNSPGTRSRRSRPGTEHWLISTLTKAAARMNSLRIIWCLGYLRT